MDVLEQTIGDVSSVTFHVKVSPNARQTKWLGTYGSDLKVSINATPEKGKANDALIKYFAKEFSVPKKYIAIISGDTNTLKKIKIDHLSKEEFLEKYDHN